LEAEKYFDRCLKLDGNSTEALERYIFHSNYIPYFNKKKYSELIQRFYKLIKKKALEKKIAKQKKELYVGFVGATFFNHAVGFQILDVIKELNKNKNIKIFAYSNFKHDDFLRKEFKKNFYAWNDIDSLNSADAAKIIQGQNIDILIDLDGYTKNNSLKLFSFKPAPIQISWCGYLNSTGIKEIDYIIADQEVITKQTEDFYSEKILRLPNFFVNMSKPEGDLFISREIPAKKNKYITYCSFNNVLKYNLEVIKCWCEILESVKNSKLILLDSRYNEEEYCKYILELFNNNKKKDILFNNNIIFLGYKNRKDLLEMYNKADIALDTFPYGGITTSLEAVYMGVPVLTIKGDSFFSRATFSLNRNLGLDNFIANDKDNYIKKAIELSKNLYKIQDIKDFLLRNKSNLDPFNSKKFADEFLKLITSLKD
jgi:predicted O-linked N-acetylglucosamine transferase (SPINDLY family)